MKRIFQLCFRKLYQYLHFHAHKSPIQFSMAVVVVVLHIALLMCGVLKFYTPPEKQKPPRLRIQVVELNPPKELPRQNPPKPAPPAPPEPIPEPSIPKSTPPTPPEPIPEPPAPKKDPPQAIVEPTPDIQPAPPPKPKIAKPVVKAEPKPATKPKPKPVAKPDVKPKPAPKNVPKTPAKKTPTPPPVTKKEKAWSAKQQKLLEDIQKQVSSVQYNTTQPSTQPAPSKVPDKIGSLNVEKNSVAAEDMGEEELHYQDELMLRLRLLLRLPEKGEVHIALTLNRQGNIVRLKVKDANTQSNKDYIEHNLPDVTFPPFGIHFPGEKQHSFEITLTSEK